MFSKEEVKSVASLSRIHLNDDELSDMTKTLGDILLYVEKLKTLNVSGIQATSHVLPLKDVFREDKIQPSIPREDVLKIAPAHQGGFFKVPQVIE